jgi:hypothetical protein
VGDEDEVGSVNFGPSASPDMPQEAPEGPFASGAGASQSLPNATRVQLGLDILKGEEGVPEVSAVLHAVVGNIGSGVGACDVSVSNSVQGLQVVGGAREPHMRQG